MLLVRQEWYFIVLAYYELVSFSKKRMVLQISAYVVKTYVDTSSFKREVNDEFRFCSFFDL